MLRIFSSFIFTIFLGVGTCAVVFEVANATEQVAEKTTNATDSSPILTGDQLPQRNSTADTAASSSLALILKTMQLSQGEHGAELWRLKAEAANMAQKEGEIFLQSPRFTYMVPPDNIELEIISDSGNINQQSEIINFIDNVSATYATNTMRGNLLVYNGVQKTMSFPTGGVFVGDDMSGSAKQVTWHLNDQIIEATDDVNITFFATKGLSQLGKPEKEPKN